MKKTNHGFRLALRILISFAFLGYVLFLIDEKVPLLKDATFVDISVYVLFLVFFLGFILLWKREYFSGIVLIVWHLLQWCLVIWVWENGDMTLIFGFPIALLGFLLLVNAKKQKKAVLSRHSK